MKLIRLLASGIFLTSIAPAATVMMRFETTVDATEVGGAASVPLVVTYSFDSSLAALPPSSGGTSYGPLSSLEINVGGEIISSTVNATITIWNNNQDGDEYQVSLVGSFLSPEYSVYGAPTWGFRMLVIDPSGNMFSDESLPSSFNFGSTSGFFQQTEFAFGFGDSRFLGVTEFANTPLEERTPFTLAVVPEPSPLAIFGVAACGTAWIRRRTRR